MEIEYIDDEEKEKGFSFCRRARFRAYPWPNRRFVSWGGDLTGPQNPIETTIDSEMTVNAIFVSEGGERVVQKSFSKPITSLLFINENEGWVTTTPDENAFTGGSIYHTKDGGETWTEQLKGDPYKEFCCRIEFTDSNTGWTFGDPKNLRTTNGGNSWGNASNSLFNVDFMDSMNGYGLQKSGNNADIFRTSNQGDTGNLKVLSPILGTYLASNQKTWNL